MRPRPGTSDQTVGITNALDVLQVSPTDTALELGQSTPAVSDAPKTYFQSWGTYGRTFAGSCPSSADEAKALVAEMKAQSVTSLFVANDGSDYGRALADAVRTDASAAGLTVASSASGASARLLRGDQPGSGRRLLQPSCVNLPQRQAVRLLVAEQRRLHIGDLAPRFAT